MLPVISKMDVHKRTYSSGTLWVEHTKGSARLIPNQAVKFGTMLPTIPELRKGVLTCAHADVPSLLTFVKCIGKVSDHKPAFNAIRAAFPEIPKRGAQVRTRR